MTPQELKESILRMAMKGQLTTRNDFGKTGKDFYQEILSYRKSNNIVDNKKIKDDEGDVPFEIPDTWVWAKFGRLVEYHMGKTPPRAETEWWKDDVPWVSISDMPESGHVDSTKEKVSTKAFNEKFGRNISRKGSLLMSFKLTVGRVSILDIDAVHNEAIITIDPLCDKDGIFKEYLFYVLPVVARFGDSKNAIKGKTLNDDSICNLFVPLPSLEEQRQIVRKIEEFLPLLECYKRTWGELEELNKKFPLDMEKSILQLAIQGKLVEQRSEEGTGEELFDLIQKEKRNLAADGKIKKEKALSSISDVEIPFEIPNNWKWTRLGEISSYSSTKNKINGLDIGQDVWSLDLEDIEKDTGNILSFVKAKDRKIVGDKTIFKKGQVLYSKLRPYLKKILVAPADGVCTPELVPFDVYGNISREYLVFVLKSPHIDYIINSVTYGVKMPRVGTETMVNLLIPLPPLAEQKRIVAKLEELLPLVYKIRV